MKLQGTYNKQLFSLPVRIQVIYREASEETKTKANDLEWKSMDRAGSFKVGLVLK